MFLLDANLWMQLARSRPHAPEVRAFLGAIPSERLFVTDFAVNSIAINFERRDQLKELPAFLDMSSIGTDITILKLDISGIRKAVDTAMNLKLDYDDAYQYVAADLFGLKLVSLDTDFDKTPNGRLTPAAAMKLFNETLETKPGE